jgi:hypothetical protein
MRRLGMMADLLLALRRLWANGCGMIFKVTADGTLTTLHRFDVKDGYLTLDSASLVPGADGNFYGTTGNGGSFKNQ